MINFAPVLICTLNRYEHFKLCIQSISACTNADKTDIFIALDYPLKDYHLLGYEKIKKYIPFITGFNTVTIIERKRNFGSENNFSKLVESVFIKYDRVIIIEDDNVFSPSFLDFVNKGLHEFEKDPLVIAICGYKFPFEVPASFPHSYFYSKSFSGWGFGAWRDKYMHYRWNDDFIKEVIRYLHKPSKALLIDSYQYGFLNGLMNVVKTGNLKGDRMYCISNILNGTYCVFPTVSKVRNTGHDGSGVHCTKMEGSSNIFINQVIDSESEFNYSLHFEYENKFVAEALKKHFLEYNKLKIYHKMILLFRYFTFLIKY